MKREASSVVFSFFDVRFSELEFERLLFVKKVFFVLGQVVVGAALPSARSASSWSMANQRASITSRRWDQLNCFTHSETFRSFG